MVTDAHVSDLIAVIPEVGRLRLINLGPWKDAALEFCPGINLIRGESGSGKSFILRSMMPGADQRLVSSHEGGPGRVKVTYAWPEFEYDLPGPAGREFPDTKRLSGGQKAMVALTRAIERAKRGSCILAEDPILGWLDDEHYARAQTLINAARCQMIIVLPRRRDAVGFCSARVFECTYDPATESSSVKAKE